MWITSYDSVYDEPGTPLHDLKKMASPATICACCSVLVFSADRCTDPDFAELEPELRANPSLDSWPEGRDYLAQQKRRLPANIFKRLHLNLPGSTAPFINLDNWDGCVNPELRPLLEDRAMPVWIGVDAGYRHDYTAIVTCAYADHRVRLVNHRIFKPSPDHEIDFAETIEADAG